MKICRFSTTGENAHVGMALTDTHMLDLTAAGIANLSSVLEAQDPLAILKGIDRKSLPQLPISGVKFCAPVEQQEVWAAGVTYLRSKTARMEESDFSATAYDRVYDAERPEIFFKGLAEKVVAPDEPVGIRSDARWNVPEPELALVLNSRGAIVGCTIGNDMSSRDIEGENLLYLPQAKIYDRSCALGPWILVGSSEDDVRAAQVRMSIWRNRVQAFSGETSIGNIKRSFRDLAGYLFRSQRFARGAVLLTGTGIVPPDTFSLQEHDVIEIEIPPIGILRNPVTVV
jgi:2-dehydro-3-deoxy-D-arabinonate dehydratase